MKYCPNPHCPHRRRSGVAAEYLDSIATCADCGTPLAAEAPPPAEPTSTAWPLRSRLVVTAAVLVALIVLRELTLLPLDLGRVPLSLAGRPLAGPFGLGLFPLVVGPLLVTAVRACWPGGAGQSPFPVGRATVAATLAVAFVQAIWWVTWLSRDGALSGNPLPVLGTLLTWVGGSAAALVAMRVVGERGVGAGFSLVVLAELPRQVEPWARALADAARGGARSAEQHLLTAVVLVSLVAATVWILRVHERQRRPPEPAVPLPLPTTGLVPLDLVALVLLLPAAAGTHAFPWPALPRLQVADPAALVVLSAIGVVLGGILLNRVFVRKDELLALAAAGGAAPSSPGNARLALAVAAGRSVLFVLFVLIAGTLLSTVRGLPPLPTAYAVITWTAILLDLLGELRARRGGGLTGRFTLSRPADAEAVLRALAAAGIPAVAVGLGHRTLLQALGPCLPIEIAVAPDRGAEVDRAVAGLRAVLGVRLADHPTAR